jgi:hypothetical protein
VARGLVNDMTRVVVGTFLIIVMTYPCEILWGEVFGG